MGRNHCKWHVWVKHIFKHNILTSDRKNVGQYFVAKRYFASGFNWLQLNYQTSNQLSPLLDSFTLLYNVTAMETQSLGLALRNIYSELLSGRAGGCLKASFVLLNAATGNEER